MIEHQTKEQEKVLLVLKPIRDSVGKTDFFLTNFFLCSCVIFHLSESIAEVKLQ